MQAVPTDHAPNADLGTPLAPQERRVRLILLMIMLALVGLAYVSHSMVTTSGTSDLPVRDLAWIVPNKLMRSSQPQDIDFANLRDQFGIRGVVNLRRVESLEPNVVKSFGIAYLHVQIAPNMVPTPAQLAKIVAFLRRETAAGHAVLVHDENGRNPVTLVTALLGVLGGISSEAAVKRATVDRPRPHWTNEQVQAFDDVARVLRQPLYLPPTAHPTKKIGRRYGDVSNLRW
jgi:hypothetical protein